MPLKLSRRLERCHLKSMIKYYVINIFVQSNVTVFENTTEFNKTNYGFDLYSVLRKFQIRMFHRYNYPKIVQKTNLRNIFIC